MSITDEEVMKIVNALRPVIREEVQKEIHEEIHALETRLNRKIEGVRSDAQKSIDKLGHLIADTVGALAESLDDTYASKYVEDQVGKIRHHLHITP